MVQLSMIKILLEPSTGLATSNINAVSFEEDLPSVTRIQVSGIRSDGLKTSGVGHKIVAEWTFG